MKKTLSLLLALFIVMTSVSAFSAFPDVDSDTAAWAGDAIEALEKSGVINGYEDGTFRPGGNVTRAEFAKMLCLSFDCASESGDYSDIEGHWAEEYIIKSAGFAYAPTDNYNPDDYAERAEIAYALARVIGLEVDLKKYSMPGREWSEDEAADGETLLRTQYATDVLDRFSDSDSIEDEMKYHVALAVDVGFIQGYEDDTIRGTAPVTRAEAATLIFRAMNYQPESEESVPSDGVSEEDAIAGDNTDTDAQPDSDGKITDTVRDEDGPGEDIYDELLEQGHIYTLYPQKHLLLVSSVTSLFDEEGNEDYKLRYYIADTGDEFESVIDGDTVVAGLRNSTDEIRSGDVLFLDTGFWGKIGCLFVLASAKYDGGFASVYPDSEDWSLYPGDGEYEVFGGKLLDAKSGSKTYTLTVQGSSKTEELSILRSVSVDIYDVNGKRNGWENDDLSALADSEDTYVFVRYTDGRASEVAAFIY